MFKQDLIREIIKLVDEQFITKLWIYDMSRLSRNEEVSMYLKSKFYSNALTAFILKVFRDLFKLQNFH